MTEYLPIFLFAGAALCVLAVVRQVRNAQKECLPPKEPFKYSMPIETTKAALDQIMTESIQLKGTDLFWQPVEPSENREGFISSKYKIHYKYDSHTDDYGTTIVRSTILTLVAKLQAADSETSLAEFSFEEVKYALGQYAESDYLKEATLSRIIQRLAQVSIQRQGQVQSEGVQSSGVQ